MSPDIVQDSDSTAVVIVHRTSAGLQLGDHKVYTTELPNFDIDNVMNTQYSEKTLAFTSLL